MGTFKNLSGERFGRLFVVDRAPNDGRRTAWNCVCDCGRKTVTRSESLASGDSRSCGCLQAELSRERKLSHGHAGQDRSSAYQVWASMIQRCSNPKNKDYPNYGARGIAVCERWTSFENFLADMGEPGEGLSIDRYPDTNGNYEPSNCRWANRTEQNGNRRNVTMYEMNGRRMHLKDWSKESSIPYRTLLRRVKDSGWSLEAALSISTDNTGHSKDASAYVAREMANEKEAA